MKHRLLIGFILAVMAISAFAAPAAAATTADITLTATPTYIAIACNQSAYNFGTVAASSTTQTTTSWATVTNTSTVATDIKIAVTTSTWAGGATWTHSDTATAGADTAGLKSNAGGSWGTGDVIVKYNTPNNIQSNLAATTNFSFGLELLAPSSFSDGVAKTIVVRLTAAAH